MIKQARIDYTNFNKYSINKNFMLLCISADETQLLSRFSIVD